MKKSATRLTKIRNRAMSWTAARMLINSEPDEMKRCILFAAYARQHLLTLKEGQWRQLRDTYPRTPKMRRAEHIAIRIESAIAWRII